MRDRAIGAQVVDGEVRDLGGGLGAVMGDAVTGLPATNAPRSSATSIAAADVEQPAHADAVRDRLGTRRGRRSAGTRLPALENVSRNTPSHGPSPPSDLQGRDRRTAGGGCGTRHHGRRRNRAAADAPDQGDGADDGPRAGPDRGRRPRPRPGAIPVPADRLRAARGATGSTWSTSTSAPARPPSRWSCTTGAPGPTATAGPPTRTPTAAALVADREFRAQNVFAVAAHTLALFERHLGRPMPWHSGGPQLYLVPQAMSRPMRSTPASTTLSSSASCPPSGTPALYTALSYDVIAHEVSHAILDGLRPRFTEPGLPDQLAFHEALADLVAMLSVFDLDGVAEHLLTPTAPARSGSTRRPRRPIPSERRAGSRARRAEEVPAARLAEQLRRPRRTPGDRPPPALRRSVELPTGQRGRPTPSSPSRTAAPRCWSRRSCRPSSRSGRAASTAALGRRRPGRRPGGRGGRQVGPPPAGHAAAVAGLPAARRARVRRRHRRHPHRRPAAHPR